MWQFSRKTSSPRTMACASLRPRFRAKAWIAADWFHCAGAPYDVGRMGRQPHGLQQGAVISLVVAQSSVGPACDKERLAVRVEKNAIGAVACLESLNQHARLRVNYYYRILKQIRCIDEPPIGRHRDVANEILDGTLGIGHDWKGARGR